MEPDEKENCPTSTQLRLKSRFAQLAAKYEAMEDDLRKVNFPIQKYNMVTGSPLPKSENISTNSTPGQHNDLSSDSFKLIENLQSLPNKVTPLKRVEKRLSSNDLDIETSSVKRPCKTDICNSSPRRQPGKKIQSLINALSDTSQKPCKIKASTENTINLITDILTVDPKNCNQFNNSNSKNENIESKSSLDENSSKSNDTFDSEDDSHSNHSGIDESNTDDEIILTALDSDEFNSKIDNSENCKAEDNGGNSHSFSHLIQKKCKEIVTDNCRRKISTLDQLVTQRFNQASKENESIISTTNTTTGSYDNSETAFTWDSADYDSSISQQNCSESTAETWSTITDSSTEHGMSLESNQSSFTEANSSNPTKSELITCLTDEALRQQSVLLQISSALNASEKQKPNEFHVEAHRMLLLATTRRLALLRQIEELSHPRKSPSTRFLTPCNGTVTLRNIRIPLSPDAIYQMKTKNEFFHYLCLFRYKTQIVCSECLTPNVGNTSLNFNDTISFHNVTPDFTVLVEIYYYRKDALKGSISASSSVKYSSLADLSISKKRKFGSPFLKKKHQSPLTTKSSKLQVRTSDFRLDGIVELRKESSLHTVHTLKKSTPLNSFEPVVTGLNSKINLEMQLFPAFTMSHKGFLYIYDEQSETLFWQRRWSVLDNTQIIFWEYPEDENVKRPLKSLSLKFKPGHSVGEVRSAKRTECARPNSFIIPVTKINRPINHLISTDTREERKMWMDKINQVVINSETWGVF